ncbi:hypothetical protein COI59_19915 [Bacillus toyonensis]|nr:hypothetical protein COI59_19915 [Bacillus toyonensis]
MQSFKKEAHLQRAVIVYAVLNNCGSSLEASPYHFGVWQHRHQAKEKEIPQKRKNRGISFHILNSISLFMQQNLYFFPLLRVTRPKKENCTKRNIFTYY